MIDKKRVLVLNGQYLPGYRGGGPIQSCVNMIENLSDKFEFYVLTADRDFKSKTAYKNVIVNEWNQIKSAKVFYMTPDRQTIKGFNEVFKSIDFDVIYLNGFFSPIFTIKPLILRLLGRLKDKKIILTPRGDFTGGCENKKIKKYAYIYLCKIIGLYRGLIWHATSELEELDVRKKFKNARICTVPNLATKYEVKKDIIEKKEGQLKLVFISRIFPKKNLKFAIEVLKEIKEGDIIFDIYGPMEDIEYWEECKKIINEVPPNIKIKYNGEVEHCEIGNVFSKYHAFFFPTLGENYGHVIVEAMMSNCLCILSKGVTPWDDYADIGVEVEELSNKYGFVRTINRLLSLKNSEYINFIIRTQEYIKEKTSKDTFIEKYYKELI